MKQPDEIDRLFISLAIAAAGIALFCAIHANQRINKLQDVLHKINLIYTEP
jgi:hypothetical protein